MCTPPKSIAVVCHQTGAAESAEGPKGLSGGHFSLGVGNKRSLLGVTRPMERQPPTPESPEETPDLNRFSPNAAPYEPKEAQYGPYPATKPAPIASPRPDVLLGDSPSLLAVTDHLLRSPGSVLFAMNNSSKPIWKLLGATLLSILVVGLILGTFSGGQQIFVVPLRLTVGLGAAAFLCLPSLYIFSALSGAPFDLRRTAGILAMGLALMSILLLGLSPIAWVFSQASSSAAFVGGTYIMLMLLSAMFGVGLIRRAVSSQSGESRTAISLWGLLFILVLCQMTTTLRPLVGPYDGELFHQRLFFLAHWFAD